MTCDLHVHSCYSFDGVASLEEIYQSARNQGIAILALTDTAICWTALKEFLPTLPVNRN